MVRLETPLQRQTIMELFETSADCLELESHYQTLN